MANKKKTLKAKPKAKPVAKKVVAKKVVAKKPMKKTAPAKKTTKKLVKPIKKTASKSLVKKASAKKTASKKVSAKKPTAKVAKKPTAVVKLAKLVTKTNVDYSKAITPLADRIVVRVESPERVTAGGLIIPSSVSQATGFLKATVLAVGTGATNKKGMLRPLDVKNGDTVLFADHAGTKVEFNSEELQIIHEYDVMGIVQ